MIRYIVACWVLFTAFPNVKATHLVGGEMSLTDLKKTVNETFEPKALFSFKLVMYFDELHGDHSATDEEISIYIFQKNGHIFMDSFVVKQPIYSPIYYTQPTCANDSLLETSRVRYERQSLALLIEKYQHEDGYYMMWGRCCRNDAISNIVAPDSASQVFYLEFPALSLSEV